MNLVSRRTKRLAVALIVIGGLVGPFPVVGGPVALATTLDVGSSTLEFRNTPDSSSDIGAFVEPGFSHRYEDVVTVDGTKIDAIVTFLSATGIDSDDEQDNGADNVLDFLDGGDSDGDDAAIDLYLDVFGDSRSASLCSIASTPPCTGEIVLRVAFVQDGTTTAATLQNLKITVKDIDSRQFVEYSAVQSYELSGLPPTELTASTPSAGRTRFSGPASSSSSSDEENWVQVSFAQLSFIDITLGANEAGSAYFGLEFSPAEWSSEPDITNVAAPTYTLTYDNNGSSEPDPAPTTGSGELIVAAAPTRDGFVFTGWNTAADGSGVKIPAGSGYTPASSLTLYAQWVGDTLTVTYDSQGGSAVADGSTTTGGVIASSPGTPTRAGFVFAGWFAASSGGSAISFPYTHGQTEDFTLYAQWTVAVQPTVVGLTVSIDEQGGSTVADLATVAGGLIASSPGTPTRAGFVFAGWFAAASGGSAISFPWNHGRVANFTLYAQWKRLPTFNALSGDPSPNSSFVLVASSGDMRTELSSDTPTVCRVIGFSVVFITPGECRVQASADGSRVHTFTAQVIAGAGAGTGTSLPEGTARLAARVVYFEPDSAALTGKTRRQLRRLLADLRRAGVVTVSGHAADAGDPRNAVALGLSRRRAQAVGEFLAARGVVVSIETSQGKQQPASTERVMNRRVEIAWFITGS